MGFTNGDLTILAGAALEPYRRVRFNGTAWVYAGAGENHDAVTMDRIANGEYGRARPRDFAGTVEIEVSTTVTAGATLYADASGKVGTTQKGGAIFKALAAVASTSGTPRVECVPIAGGNAEVFEISYTATAGDDAANNATIDTGFGVNASFVQCDIIGTTGVHRKPQSTVVGTLGSYIITDSGLAVNEKIQFRAKR